MIFDNIVCMSFGGNDTGLQND